LENYITLDVFQPCRFVWYFSMFVWYYSRSVWKKKWNFFLDIMPTSWQHSLLHNTMIPQYKWDIISNKDRGYGVNSMFMMFMMTVLSRITSLSSSLCLFLLNLRIECQDTMENYITHTHDTISNLHMKYQTDRGVGSAMTVYEHSVVAYRLSLSLLELCVKTKWKNTIYIWTYIPWGWKGTQGIWEQYCCVSPLSRLEYLRCQQTWLRLQNVCTALQAPVRVCVCAWMCVCVYV